MSIFLGRAMPGPGEPLFLPDDTATALALAASTEGVCSECGTHPDEWQYEVIDARTGQRHRRDYVVPPYVPRTEECPGCDVIHTHRTTIPKRRRERARVSLRRNPLAPIRLPRWLDRSSGDPDPVDGSPVG